MIIGYDKILRKSIFFVVIYFLFGRPVQWSFAAPTPESVAKVSFEEGMGATRGIYETFLRAKKIVLVSEGRLAIKLSGQDYIPFFKTIYENNIQKILDASSKKIPKKLHQIWIGSKLPEKYEPLIKTWQEKHSDWEYKLWTDDDLDKFPMINKSLYNSTKNYGEKADIARLEILFSEGGVLADIDFLCINSLDMFRVYDFFASLRPVRPDYLVVAMGLIGTVAGHPLLKKCLEELPHFRRENSVLQRTGPVFLTKIIYNNINNLPGNNIILPALFLLPLGNPGSKDEFSTCDHIDPDKSFTHHYWDANWLK